MGYNLHITRAEKNWLSMSNPISLDEWRELVEKDPEMNMDKKAEFTNPSGQTIAYTNEGLAAWRPDPNNRNKKVWFDYCEGKIIVKNPDNKVLEKMLEIASLLRARVLGDEGDKES